MTDTKSQPGSSSIDHPDYWWYRARTELLRAALGDFLGEPRRLLDVGSADGPSVQWMQGDHQRVAIDLDPRGLAPGEGLCASALALPFRDGSFDVVLSVYGSIFAPQQELAATELLRVCRPGGTIGMANWTPEGFWGESFALLARYIPPAAGLRPATEWGTERRLRELFGDRISAMHIEPRSALFRFRSSRHWIEVFSTYFGPIMRTLETLDGQRRASYLADLESVLQRFNRSGDDTLVVSADYLEVVMTKR